MMAARNVWSGVATALVGFALASVVPPASAQSDWLQELETDCDNGDGQACSNLGSQLRLGQLAPRDLPRARRFFEKGCDLDSTSACVELYKDLSLGEGGPTDRKRAKALEARACNTGIISFEVYLEANGLCD